MSRPGRIASRGLILVAIGMAGIVIYGRERLWERFAPTDLGPIDFARIERSASGNDALAASASLSGDPDITLPDYAADAETVLGEIDARISGLGEAVTVVERSPTTRRIVTRSRLMRFPDTTVIEAVPLPHGGTGVRAYARASLGKSDLGANEARLRRWLLDLPLPLKEREVTVR